MPLLHVLLLATGLCALSCAALAANNRTTNLTAARCRKLSGEWLLKDEFRVRLKNAYSDCSLFGLDKTFCSNYVQHVLDNVDTGGKHVCLHAGTIRRLLREYRNQLPIPATYMRPAFKNRDRYREVPPMLWSSIVRKRDRKRFRYAGGDVASERMVAPVSSTVDRHVGVQPGRTSVLRGKSTQKEEIFGVELGHCDWLPSYSEGTIAFVHCASFICSHFNQMPHERAGEHEDCCRLFQAELGANLDIYCWFYPME